MDDSKLELLFSKFKQNPELSNLIEQYVDIALGNTDSCNANIIEGDICTLSSEINKLTMSKWIENKQNNASIHIKSEGNLIKSGKKDNLAFLFG